MVESKLRVEITDIPTLDNGVYGTFHHKFVIEDTIVKEKHLNDIVPPSGVSATFETEDDTIEVKVSKGYFDGISDTGWCYAQFTHQTCAYELQCQFDGDNLVSVELHKWSTIGDFEEGLDSDTIYQAKEFESYNTI